jgi:outer membrane receptor protein involved in Fe transport
MKFFRKSAFSTTTCLATFAIAAFGSATAVQAQDAAPADSAEACADANDNGVCDADEKKGEIVVTGSRISRPNLESAVPIASIGGEEFTSEGETNIGEVLNDLPQLRSTFSQQNPGLGIGIAGLNLLDLRGLGTSRTLVLVNGRRHVPADILNNAVSPDINSIPADLIERVDIVTGGNSAIYGSDAIAGVVNFVLRKKYDGLQVRASAGITEGGWGGGQYVSAMWGKNFADGRANITLHGEFSHQDRVFASDIDWIKSNDGFATTDLDTGGLTNGSDGFPDASFFRDFRSATIHRYGLMPVNQRTGNPVCGQGYVATNGAPSTTGGSSFNCTYIFDADGNLSAQTGTRFGSGILGAIVGGNGQTGREGELLSVVPKYDRYSFNMLGHYEFSDAAEFFVEAKWNRVKTRGSNAAPSFTQGTGTQFDFRERVRLDNPFLGTANRTLLANAIIASGCNTSLTVACPAAGNLTAAQAAAVTAGTYRTVIAKQFADVGIRDEDFQRDTWRVVGGLRGSFNDDWKYEISANYGKFQENTTQYGYLDRQKFMLAFDAGLDPATNTIRCRAQYDPASALALQRGDLSATQNAFLANRLAADIAACIPYNPFGAGANNAASVAYFSYAGKHKASLEQLIFNGSVSGDTSGFFNLPGGPVGFAIGAEYRREKAYYQQDSFVEAGYTNAVVIPTFNPAAFEVKEAFGEILIPVLKDTPFFQELTLSGAGRVADYNGSTGTVWAYNAGAQWRPIKDLMLRGNYARAVRAPNLSETGFPAVNNFAPGFGDPCSPARINANANRTTNCQTALGANLVNITDTTYSLPVVSGSNANLAAERSNSWTFGGVFQPSYAPGLSITVDYYNITVNGIIASVGAQGIANACYDQPTLNNPFCSQFTRWAGPGAGPFGEVPGAILGNSLINAPLNFQARKRRGIDTQVSYRKTFSDSFKLTTNVIWTHNLQISNFQSTTDPTFENRILSELGDPKDEFRWDTDLTFGNFVFGYRMRYIGPMVTNAYEDFNSLQGRPPQNADSFNIEEYPAVFYHDIRFEFDVPEGGIGKSMLFYVGVNNLLNTAPPLGSTATGVGSAIYDFRGRNYYAGIRARF